MFKNIDKVVLNSFLPFLEDIVSMTSLEIPFYWKLLVIGKKREKKISKEKIIIRQAESLVPVPKDAPQGRKKLTP